MSKDSEGFSMSISNPWLVAAGMLPALHYTGVVDWPLWVVFAPFWIQGCRFVALLGAYIWKHQDQLR